MIASRKGIPLKIDMRSRTTWYPYLVHKEGQNRKPDDCLLELYKPGGEAVICSRDRDLSSWRRDPAKKQSATKEYTYFGSYLEVLRYLREVPVGERCLYEVVFADQPQKPHFDLDISSSTHTVDQAEAICEAVVVAVVAVLEREYDTRLDLARDLVLTTSHGPTKCSWHIVVDHYAHANNREAKHLYTRVMEELRKTDTPGAQAACQARILDHGVYSSKQSFRLLGCQKRGTTRVKTLASTFVVGGVRYDRIRSEVVRNDRHALNVDFLASLVCLVGACKSLPRRVPEADPLHRLLSERGTLHGTVPLEVTTDEVEASLHLLATHVGIPFRATGFPYEVREVQGSLIVLNRVASSYCRLCQCVHDAEHPYLTLVGPTRRVWFHCRRAEDLRRPAKWIVGDLRADAVTAELPPPVETPAAAPIVAPPVPQAVDVAKKMAALRSGQSTSTGCSQSGVRSYMTDVSRQVHSTN